MSLCRKPRGGLGDWHFPIKLLRRCCQPIRSHVRKLLIANSDANRVVLVTPAPGGTAKIIIILPKNSNTRRACNVPSPRQLSRCFDTWWRHEMETFSELLATCAGIHRSPVKSHTKASDAELIYLDMGDLDVHCLMIYKKNMVKTVKLLMYVVMGHLLFQQIIVLS